MTTTNDDAVPAGADERPVSRDSAMAPRRKETTRWLLYGPFMILCVIVLSAPILWVVSKRGARRVAHVGGRQIGAFEFRRMARRSVELGGPAALLSDSPVRSDLGLSADQARRLKAVFTETGERESAQIKTLAKQVSAAAELGPSRELNELAGKMEKVSAEGTRRVNQAARAILTPSQYHRLEEIVLQSRGLIACVTDPEIALQLGLTTAQRLEIEGVLDRMKRRENEIELARREFWETVPIHKRNPRDPLTSREWAVLNGFGDRLRQSEADAVQEIEKILTSRQKSVYQAMTGPAFDFTRR